MGLLIPGLPAFHHMRPERICTALNRSETVYLALAVLQENAIIVLLFKEAYHLEKAHIHNAAVCISECLDIKAEARYHSVNIVLAEKDIAWFATAAVGTAFTLELQTPFIEAVAHLNPSQVPN